MKDLIAQGPVDVNVEQLRDWLERQGFGFGNNQFHGQMNDCDWYAWRRSKLSERECECNGPKMQIVLTPHSYSRDGKLWESVEADVTGECAGVWYKLQAYSLSPADLMERLDEIEAALVGAWNSLKPNAVRAANDPNEGKDMSEQQNQAEAAGGGSALTAELGVAKCLRCEVNAAKEPHACPYAQDIGGSTDDAYCTCCAACHHACAMDI